MKKASFIFSPLIQAEALELCIDSLLCQRWKNLEVLVFRDSHRDECESWPHFENSRVVPISFDPGKMSLPGRLNFAVSRSSGDVLFFVADCVVFSKNFLQVFLDHLAKNSQAAWLYGDFLEAVDSGETRLRQVRTHCCDFSEGSQIGPVRGIPRARFDAEDGYAECLEYAFEYDLRLRLLETGEAIRIDSPLYTVLPSIRNEPTPVAHQHFRSYVCSDSAHGARSYLDYKPDEEQEFRDTCYRALQRRNTFIKEPTNHFSCRHSVSGNPDVTVIVPLWNREKTIGPALESVLQSQPGPFEFEIVVVDNGSTDDSLEVVRNLMSEGPVRLLCREVNNIAGALNDAVRTSNAKYICQLDSDDLYTPETLATLVQYMETNPQAALGVSYYDFIGPDGESLEDRGIVRHLEYDPNNLMRTDGIGHARIWHRCVLEDLGGFDENNLGNYAEDYDLQLKLCESYKILRIPHVLYHYRINHKQPGETIDYCRRHEMKTLAREMASGRRLHLNTR